jgi:hypothetical protein
MCVRTKNSYGCGCSYKSRADCHSSRCPGPERFEYIREGDCSRCKKGGEVITRGRDGKGRYAQEITRRSPPVDIPTASSQRSILSSEDRHWAVSNRAGDEWHSPTRALADDGWNKEHQRRMEDLQSTAESMSLSAATSSTPRPTVRAPSPCPSPEIEEFSDNYYSQDEEVDQRSKHTPRRILYGEVKSIKDSSSRHGPRTSAGRYESNDSLDSMTKVRIAPPSQLYEIRDPYDSGYGSYDSYDRRRSHRRGHGARTEPYHYATPAQRHVYEVPISASPYGYPHGSYGVEVHPSAHYLSRW